VPFQISSTDTVRIKTPQIVSSNGRLSFNLASLQQTTPVTHQQHQQHQQLLHSITDAKKNASEIARLKADLTKMTSSAASAEQDLQHVSKTLQDERRSTVEKIDAMKYELRLSHASEATLRHEVCRLQHLENNTVGVDEHRTQLEASALELRALQKRYDELCTANPNPDRLHADGEREEDIQVTEDAACSVGTSEAQHTSSELDELRAAHAVASRDANVFAISAASLQTACVSAEEQHKRTTEALAATTAKLAAAVESNAAMEKERDAATAKLAAAVESDTATGQELRCATTRLQDMKNAAVMHEQYEQQQGRDISQSQASWQLDDGTGDGSDDAPDEQVRKTTETLHQLRKSALSLRGNYDTILLSDALPCQHRLRAINAPHAVSRVVSVSAASPCRMDCALTLGSNILLPRPCGDVGLHVPDTESISDHTQAHDMIGAVITDINAFLVDATSTPDESAATKHPM